MVPWVAEAVAVVVTRGFVLTGIVCTFSNAVMAGVLPEDRSDVLYHSFDGGGVTISGPSILVRKQIGSSLSVVANHYVDHVSSASIDVVTTASAYIEERTQQSLGFDYLDGKTTMSLSHTTSKENDFDARTTSFSISQDMFGDLTTVTMSYARGDDVVGKRNDTSFKKPVVRQNYGVSLTQILSTKIIANVDFETITDEGFLNNPYRSVRYVDGGSYSYQAEAYPKTRTSNALAMRGKYFLDYRAALEGEFRVYQDSWGIIAGAFEIGYVQPAWDNWILETKYRVYSQTRASFYSDLYPYVNAQNFLARDKELSSFSDAGIHIGLTYEFAKGGWGFINKGSANLGYTYLNFAYKDFRDLRATGYPLGQEPLYNFSAKVLQLYLSIWY